MQFLAHYLTMVSLICVSESTLLDDRQFAFEPRASRGQAATRDDAAIKLNCCERNGGDEGQKDFHDRLCILHVLTFIKHGKRISNV